MKEGYFKVSNDVMDVYGTAAEVACSLNEEAISTFDFFISTITYAETDLAEAFYKLGITINPEEIILEMELNKELYQKVTGKNYEDYLAFRQEFGKVYDLTAKTEKGEKILSVKTFGEHIDIYKDASDELTDALALAYSYCVDKGQDYVDLNSIIYAILYNAKSSANAFLDVILNKKNKNVVINGIKSLMLKENGDNKLAPVEGKANISDLGDFVTCLNDKYTKDATCDILGRDNEIFKVWNIISKKTKRNAVLIGAPGVGKSAIVEAITYSIVKKTCPKGFEKYKVYELNLNSMVAGTKYRGEFEAKVQRLVKFLESHKDIIVFVDEIHEIIGTGSAEGTGPDLSGSLKPLLARDDVVFIGATTIDEYNRIFRHDGAFSRRFEVVQVEEPKFSDVKSMIKGRVETLSKYHNVTISDELLDKVLIYATAFSDVSNPDRTIDLVDKSMAVAKMLDSKEVKESHIKLVYKDYYDAYAKMSAKSKLSTAYHEAGHFVMWYTSKSKLNEDCILISIIPVPDKGWLGVNMFEDVEISKYRPMDFSFIKERVATSLAGRISQKLVQKELDSGASSDLDNATRIVEEYLLHFGLDESYKNYSFSNRNESLKISDKVSDEIRVKTQKIINEVYAKTERAIKKNRNSIDCIAKALVKHGMITKEEAIEAFNKGKEDSRAQKSMVKK